MYRFKDNEIVVLLGAGASIEAGIPHSRRMIESLELLLDAEWSEYRALYLCVKSSIFYAYGIRGIDPAEKYNIELLVGTLEELSKKDEHPIYPFVGAWNPKLSEVAGSDFGAVKGFREAIVRKLKEEWVEPEHDDDSGYYRGLFSFQEEYTYPLRVFSLNYDLCVEHNKGNSVLQTGFRPDKTWDWKLFEASDKDDTPNIYLYKLHGSIDWVFDRNHRLKRKSSSHISPQDVAIIFGTTYKLQYTDPFLFSAYELRKWTLDEQARLILSIGYGFGDEHINSILSQSLRSDSKKRLLSVSPENGREGGSSVAEISRRLSVDASQVRHDPVGAKEFLSTRLTVSHLAEFVTEENEWIEEVPRSRPSLISA